MTTTTRARHQSHMANNADGDDQRPAAWLVLNRDGWTWQPTAMIDCWLTMMSELLHEAWCRRRVVALCDPSDLIGTANEIMELDA